MERHYFWAFFIVAIVLGAAIGISYTNSRMTGYAITSSTQPQNQPLQQQAIPITIQQPVTYQGVLNMLNKCSIFSGTLAEDQSCNDVCANPIVWGQNAPSGTCILAEFGSNDPYYSGSLSRCGFKEKGRPMTCVCCSTQETVKGGNWGCTASGTYDFGSNEQCEISCGPWCDLSVCAGYGCEGYGGCYGSLCDCHCGTMAHITPI